FIQRFCGEMGRPACRLHPDALRALTEYAWPGNVRELKNVIERVLLLEAEDEILAHHLPAELTGGAASTLGGRFGSDAAGGAAVDPFPPGVVRPLAELEQMAI